MINGFVEWADFNDVFKSADRMVSNTSRWPQLKVLICEGNMNRKYGKQLADNDSHIPKNPALRFRLRDILSGPLAKAQDAIEARDFQRLAEVTKAEMYRTYYLKRFGRRYLADEYSEYEEFCPRRKARSLIPKHARLAPCCYTIAMVVHAMSEAAERAVAAYLFDAGALTFLLVLEDDIPSVLRALRAVFFIRDRYCFRSTVPLVGWDEYNNMGRLHDWADFKRFIHPMVNGLTRIICTSVN